MSGLSIVFKIDFLNVSIYENIRDEAHLIQLMETEPLWDLLLQEDFTDLLFHVNGHGNLLKQMKPSSIEELAMCLALIRPAKKHLIGLPWGEVAKTVWEKESDDYHFKKSHSVAYANLVVVHMNLLAQGLGHTFDESN